MVCHWTWDEIARLPLPRLWGMFELWGKRPPTHRLLAMFFGYGEGTASPKPKQGFEVTDSMLQAFGGSQRRACRQSQLPDHMRKKVEEFQSTPAYQEFRQKWREKLAPKGSNGRS